jgi:hypothetical protein
MYKQMKKLLRKALIVFVLFAPLFVNTDCKKQKRCGCPPRGDELFLYERENKVYFEDDSPMIMMYENSGYTYNTYSFCNPDEIRPKLENLKNGDELVVKGNVYWDCNYVMQASNNPYYGYNYGTSYNIYVTDIYKNMYGKDNSDETLKGAK